MHEEVVVLGKDNVIARTLRVDDKAIVHNALTRCQARVGSTLIDSATSPALFDWSQPDRLIFKFGQSSLTAGRYPVALTVFNAENPNGLEWLGGGFVIVVR